MSGNLNGKAQFWCTLPRGEDCAASLPLFRFSPQLHETQPLRVVYERLR